MDTNIIPLFYLTSLQIKYGGVVVICKVWVSYSLLTNEFTFNYLMTVDTDALTPAHSFQWSVSPLNNTFNSA